MWKFWKSKPDVPYPPEWDDAGKYTGWLLGIAMKDVDERLRKLELAKDVNPQPANISELKRKDSDSSESKET